MPDTKEISSGVLRPSREGFYQVIEGPHPGTYKKRARDAEPLKFYFQ